VSKHCHVAPLGMICKPLEQQLSLPLPTKQQWLKSIQVAMAWKWEHNFRAYAAKHCFMRMWVIRPPRPGDPHHPGELQETV